MTTPARVARVRRTVALPLLLAAAVSALAACSSVPEGPKPMLSGTQTLLTTNPGFYGDVLTDGGGRVLYQFSGDRVNGPATCNGSCAMTWEPYIATGEPSPKVGTINQISEQDLGTITRNDGRQQVTFAGHPLYYFTGDRKPGDIQGAGQTQFGGRWTGVTSNGSPVYP